VLLLAASICGRPMLLGNEYAPVSLFIMVFLICWNILESNGKLAISKTRFPVFCAGLIFFVYCCIQGIILGADLIYYGLADLLYLVISFFAFYTCFMDKDIQRTYIRGMYVLMVATVISFVITLVFALTSSWQSVYITSIDYNYFADIELYFPATITYGRVTFNGIPLQRMLGFAREAGIMQVFYVWAFFMADKYFRKPNLIKVIMAVGVCTCMSTAGFVTFGIALILSLNIRKFFSIKTLVTAGLAAVMVYILFFSSGLSLADKASLSVNDRVNPILIAWEMLGNRPLFGYGYSDTLGLGGGGQIGISAVSSLAQVGIIGFMLWFAIYGCGFVAAASRKRYLYATAAWLITALFSQPLMTAPITYWFLFVDYSDERVLPHARSKIRFRLSTN